MTKKQIPKLSLHPVEPDLKSEEMARLEAEDFSDEILEQKARLNYHHRSEWSKFIISCGSIGICVVVFCGIVAGIICLFYHWVTPETWHFLRPPQIDNLKTIAFSALATTIFKEAYKKFS